MKISKQLDSLKVAISGEAIKLKGLYINITAIISGVIAPLIIFIVERRLNPRVPHNAFINFTEASMEFYISYFLPLFIIYSVMIFTYIEHKRNGWQLMNTLPVNKSAIYISKLIHISKSVLYSIISHMLMVIICVYVLSSLGKLPENASVELQFSFFSNITLRILAASLFLISFQFLISVFVSKYILPVFIGLIGFGIHLVLMENNATVGWYPFGPIASTYDNMHGSLIGNYMIYTEWISIIAALIITIIGINSFKFKSFTLFLKQSIYKLSGSIIAISSLIVILCTQITPNSNKLHNRTIIAGETKYSNIKNAYLIDEVADDTLARIPVVNQKFHHKFNDKLKYGVYKLRFDNNQRKTLVLGTNDSLYISVNSPENSIRVSGTSKVETEYFNKNKFGRYPFYMLRYYVKNSSTYNSTNFFFSKIKETEHELLSYAHAYRSPDNYKLSESYKSLVESFTYTGLNYYLNTYITGWKSLNGEKKIDIPKEFQSNIHTYFNETLLNSDKYYSFILSYLENMNNNKGLDKDDLFKQSLTINDISFRDKFLYNYSMNCINQSTNLSEIESHISNIKEYISNDKYKERLLNLAITTKSLLKGNIAKEFKAVDINNKYWTLSSFKSKYLLVDVWATWCRPCIKESRFFEKYANKLKDQPIEFIALNIDENKKDWELKTGKSDGNVKHLYCTNIDEFSKHYKCDRIPRFILISPDGKIINAYMPKPSRKTFEEVLMNYINGNASISKLK